MSKQSVWHRFGSLPALTALALVVPGATSLPSAGVERFTLSGDSLAVYTLAGEITVESSTGRDAVVEVTRGGADGSRLRIERGPVHGFQTLRVVFPATRVVYERMRGTGTWADRIEVGDDGRFDDRSLLGPGAGRRQVQVSGRGSGLAAHADLRVRVPAGRTLGLFLGAGKVTVANVDGDLRVSASSAPISTEHTRGTLRIDSGSGGMRVRDAHGDVSLDSGSGGAIVRGVRGSRLRLDTGSGGMTVLDVAVDELNADTGSGSVEFADLRAPEISLDSGSGSVRVNLLSGPLRSLMIDTGSGGVTLGVPRDLNAAFDIETGSGGIRIQVPHTVETRAPDHVRGRFGGGRGRIHIESGSGGVRIVPRSAPESQHQESGLGTLLRFTFA